MDYWQTVLQEFLHRDDKNYQFIYTNLGAYQHRSRPRRSRSRTTNLEKPLKKNYWLDDRFPAIYFTEREAQTMFLLLRGGTLQEVAKYLGLSVRTIEFYVKNMRMKLNVNTKKELVDLIRQTSFQSCFSQSEAQLLGVSAQEIA